MTPAVRLPPLLFLLVILHTAVFPQLRVFDVGADVMLLVAIASGVVAGPERGATMGFVAGLLADFFLQTPFGLSALTYCLVGWAVGSFQTRILHATWWIPVLTAAFATAAGVLLFAVLGAVVGQDQLVSLRLIPIMGVTALWAAMLSPLFVRVFRWALVTENTRIGLVAR
ncbi:MAG: rod shape-determining protein MreD [Actinomycetia bacterium]|nr:rod shape-determining protein MreD [Actinomycetes bacterium]